MNHSTINILGLSGSIGDLTFVRTKNGTYVRKKRKPIGNQFKTDPAYKRVRENCSRFATAARVASLIRKAFQPHVDGGFSGQVQSRLVSLLLQIQKYAPGPDDSPNMAGSDLSLLKGFQFNEYMQLEARICVPFAKEYDRAKELLKIWIPGFDPAWHINMPETATHFRLVGVASQLDLANLVHQTATAATNHHPGHCLFRERSLDIQLSPRSGLPCLIALGLEFTTLINGIHHPILAKDTNPYSIIKLDQLI